MATLGYRTVGSNDLEEARSDEGPPGERAPNMQLSYFRDLDGNTLCAYCIG